MESSLSPQDAVDVCVLIANDYQRFIDATDAAGDMAGSWPTDTAATHLKDMAFSKRIFIYYQNPDFSLAQKGSLELLYQQKGLSIQFRDAAYAWEHRNDHPVLRPEPLTPGAVVLPRALGTGLMISVRNASPGDSSVAVINKSGEDALQLRFKQIAPYVQAVHPGTVYRIGLYNPAERLIRNVQVSLWKMEPTPRELVGATDLPYPVTRPSAGQFDRPNFEPCDINPKDEGFFELAHTWTTGPPDHRLIVNHIATKGHKLMFEMHRDEMWRLYYRVSCADHRPIEFVAIVSPLNENILVQITETV